MRTSPGTTRVLSARRGYSPQLSPFPNPTTPPSARGPVSTIGLWGRGGRQVSRPVLVVRLGVLVGLGCARAVTSPTADVANVGRVRHVTARPGRGVVGQTPLGAHRGGAAVHRLAREGDEPARTPGRRHFHSQDTIHCRPRLPTATTLTDVGPLRYPSPPRTRLGTDPSGTRKDHSGVLTTV